VPSQSSAPSESSAPSTAALKALQGRCEDTSGLSGSDAYVDCDRGFVEGTSQTCADACMVEGVSKCCTGTDACGKLESDGTIEDGFTGKGK